MESKLLRMPCAQATTVKEISPLRETNIPPHQNFTTQNVQPKMTFVQRVKQDEQHQHNMSNTTQSYQDK